MCSQIVMSMLVGATTKILHLMLLCVLKHTLPCCYAAKTAAWVWDHNQALALVAPDIAMLSARLAALQTSCYVHVVSLTGNAVKQQHMAANHTTAPLTTQRWVVPLGALWGMLRWGQCVEVMDNGGMHKASNAHDSL